MNGLNRANPLRCLAVWLAVTAAAVLIASALLPLDVTISGTFEGLIVRLSSWALLGCVAWFWLVTTIVVASALREPADAATGRFRGVPVPVRRLVLAACGVAISAGLASPALATPGPVHVAEQDHSGRVPLTGLPFPDRAITGPSPARQPSTAVAKQSLRGHGFSRHVVVRKGDSLWSIAAAHLPADASDAEVATAWHLIYERNREAIGHDPDLLIPGQHLVLPHVLA